MPTVDLRFGRSCARAMRSRPRCSAPNANAPGPDAGAGDRQALDADLLRGGDWRLALMLSRDAPCWTPIRSATANLNAERRRRPRRCQGLPC